MKNTFLAILSLCLLNTGFTQTGTIAISFTPLTGKTIQINITKPVFKFDNPHGYWFVNPHTGDRHFHTQPDRGYGNSDAAFITFNERMDDFDIYDGGSNDSNEAEFENSAYVINAPAWHSRDTDNKPMHVHITSFTASEISFAISGSADGGLKAGNGQTMGRGIISGSGHLYREPAYEKSASLPGCDCDPTIYAAVYDEENNIRTTSACENALYNKVFDAVQQALSPLYGNIGYKGSGSMAAGEVTVKPLPQCVNTNVPVKQRPYCSSDYRHNWLTGLQAQKTFFETGDAYGVRFIQMPSSEQLDAPKGGDPDFQKHLIQSMDSLVKLAAAKKLTAEQYNNGIKALSNRPSVVRGNDDFKRENMELGLTLNISINTFNREALLLKLADKNKTVVQHNIKGAAFEIFSPQIKDNEGDWLSNRLNIYIGKFTAPAPGKSAAGFDAFLTNALYPPAGNKLQVYNIIIRLEGGKDLIDKAVANIDFDALLALVANQ